jgi:hypothetical protein
VRRGRDRRPWKAGPRRRSRSSPIEQKAPARSAKRPVQLALSFSLSPYPSKHGRAGGGIKPLSETSCRSRQAVLIVLCSSVPKKGTTIFVVGQTKYGWSVRVETERLALFTTQRQALDDVKRRRAELQAKGLSSTVVVEGHESEQSPGGRPPRSHWSRR